ncbi:MAG: hypothetical protein IPJ84_13660 [Bdellovibrionales bacterium]|nr:hypothetical protein [Bdellovibrionales bacterium]
MSDAFVSNGTSIWLKSKKALRSDPRWLLGVYAICFITFAVSSPGFTRTLSQFIAGFAGCMLVECFFLYAVKKVLIFPLSGMLSSMGVFLLCDSPLVWPYFVVGCVSILSKHLLVINGSHIFNPNNFGVVMGFLFLPSYVTITASRWGPDSVVAVLLLLLGILLVIKARRLALTLSFVTVFVIGAAVRSQMTGVNLLTVLGPGLGAAFQLFIFYHITDPKTTPTKVSHQMIFGMILGVVDGVLRFHQNKYAPFIGLFILTGIYSFFKSQDSSKLKPVLVTNDA